MDEWLNYYIEWGDDNNSGWIGPYLPTEEITKSHTWSRHGTYTIKCKAKDNYGGEGDWGTLSIAIPRNQSVMVFYRFLERFPKLSPFIQRLLQGFEVKH
jgi:hypothetical protein